MIWYTSPTNFPWLKKGFFLLAFGLLIMSSCQKSRCPDADAWLQYSVTKVQQSLKNFTDTTLSPRSIPNGEDHWKGTGIFDWTSGFWPGILWYAYEYSGDTALLGEARKWTSYLEPIKKMKWKNHDLGFMMYCSYGNGLRLTGDPGYAPILLETADSLARLFNPHVGTILSWPWQKRKLGWSHNTIIDNMMNLELLFWASKNGRPEYYDLAIKHAETTQKNHIRPDFSTWHVLVYDSLTGAVDSTLTSQGASNSSMWARGQAWGIYGFTMVYRETQRKEFLVTAQKLADRYLGSLPEDFIPFWDFNAPSIPDEPRDVSAAAITASALLELSTYMKNPTDKDRYKNAACAMLRSLVTSLYLAGTNQDAILLHSVGSKPHKSEVDASIIYADYYFMEALLRLKKYPAP